MLIRSALPDDAGRILEIYSYYVENTAITFEIDVPSPDEFKKRITKTLARYPYLVLEEDGRIEGYAYAGVFYDRAAYDHSCEVTIYLDRNSHGKGYGRLLYGELEKELKARGIINLYACIADPVVEDHRRALLRLPSKSCPSNLPCRGNVGRLRQKISYKILA